MVRGSDKLSTIPADSNRSPFRPRPRATTLHVESRWHALRLAVQSTRAASPRVSGNVYASSQNGESHPSANMSCPASATRARLYSRRLTCTLFSVAQN